MYAVVGATGNTGRAVVKELEGLGENPVCIVRNADKVPVFLTGDLNARRGRILDMSQRANARVLRAEVPLATRARRAHTRCGDTTAGRMYPTARRRC